MTTSGQLPDLSSFVFLDRVHEDFKEELQVPRTAHVLRMKLNAEKGLAVVNDAFVGFVVGIGEEHRPVGRHVVDAGGKAVILCGDVAPAGPFMNTGLVVTSVAISDQKAKHINVSTKPDQLLVSLLTAW